MQRMRASGESASTIASTLGSSRATVYRVLAEEADDAKAFPRARVGAKSTPCPSLYGAPARRE